VPRRGLDRRVVVEAAAALADAEGLDHLSLAGLAKQLNVRPPSLYNHIASLDGLRRDLWLLGLRSLTARLTRATVGKAGGDAVMAMADAYRAFARDRPGIYAATLRSPEGMDEELLRTGQETLEVVLAVLSSFDLSGDDALHATRSLRAILHGFVALEALGGFGLPLDLDESFHRLIRTYIRGLEFRN
jgi:AcrR family transcriptional regulator